MPPPQEINRILDSKFDQKIKRKEEASEVAKSIKVLSFMLIDFKRQHLSEDARKILDEKTSQIFSE